LPDLTIQQSKKLKYLTIVTLSEKDKCIPYTVLQEELSIQDIRELEDVIIEAIYGGEFYVIYDRVT
jgi:COP9 signalosome complex subunit 7